MAGKYNQVKFQGCIDGQSDPRVMMWLVKAPLEENWLEFQYDHKNNTTTVHATAHDIALLREAAKKWGFPEIA